jgi:N-acetylglutamate synthase-like GNAT family acetyltransferase
MLIDFDNKDHLDDFIRLNEQWIAQYFKIEEADRKLADNPYKIVSDGGHIISLVEEGRVVGVCALFKDGADTFELARMAVDPADHGKGYSNILMGAALDRAREKGAKKVYLVSNTILAPAIALYRKHGFITVHKGPHPHYDRANIVMELRLA